MHSKVLLFFVTMFLVCSLEAVPSGESWVEKLPQGWIRSLPEENHIPSSREYPNAGAIYLLDEDILYFADRTQVEVVIMKILNRKGYKYAEISTPVYRENESVEVRGRTKKRDGSVVELRAEDIHEVFVHQELRKKKFTLPAIEDDCLIHYEIAYHSDRYPLVGIRYFQNDEPTILSRFNLILPQALELVYYDSPPGILDTTKHVSTSSSPQLRLHTFSKRNLPALETESFMPPLFDYLPSLAYSVSASGGQEESGASWENVSKWYLETVEDKFKPDGDIKKMAKSITQGYEHVEKKLERIFYFVEENFKINFPSRFVFDEAKIIFERRNGTSAEVGGVLYAMLKTIGIEATPVLVPDKEKVREIPDIPMLDWFDHLMFKVDLDNREIWLDTFYGTSQIGHVAERHQGMDGLLIQKSGGKLVKTPSLDYVENLRTCVADVKLSDGGEINCTVLEIYSPSRSARLKSHLKDNNVVERKDELAKGITEYCPGALLDTSWFADLYDFNTDFRILYKFHSGYYVNQANEMLYLNPNILHRDETAKEFSQPTRIFPIMFDEVKVDIDSVNLIIPSGYAILSLPEPINLDNDFGKYSTQYQVEDSLVIYRRRLAIKKLLIPSSAYKDIQGFFNQILEEDQKDIVLEKKE